MQEFSKTLVAAVGPTPWILGGVAGAFTTFVGVTLGVALVANGERARRATRILGQLLVVFRRGGK